MGFPTIRTIDDILPHIKGNSAFRSQRRDDYIVVTYNFISWNTLPEDVALEYLLECRGLIFRHTGEIISRPFHKFFNMGETEATFRQNIDLSRPHEIQTKVDGSMVRPFRTMGTTRLATKGGITQVSEDAERDMEVIDPYGEKKEWMEEQLDMGYTPIFEYVSPDHPIVIEYNEPDLVFLAMRDNVSGDYVDPDIIFPGSRVPRYGTVDGTIDEYAEKIRVSENVEGDVLTFEDGFRIKVKSEWYVGIHRVKDNVRSLRHVGALWMDERLDDVIGVLPEKDRNVVKETAREFETAYRAKLEDILGSLQGLKAWLEERPDIQNIRKTVALEFVPNLHSPKDGKYVFEALKGNDASLLYSRDVRNALSKNTKFEEVWEWMNDI